MGTSKEYICSSCHYKAIVCGGQDAGMIGTVETYLCHKCKRLSDVLVWSAQDFPGIIPEDELKCYECKSKTIEIWDTKNRPCPKCGGKMEVNQWGIEKLWD